MRLLDRQVKLVEYLTSGSAIFGGDGAVPIDNALHGIDAGLLRLEAQFSHQKRMEKIKSVFPLTFRLVERDCDTMVGEFARTFPLRVWRASRTRSSSMIFSAGVGRRCPLRRHISHDVAACELAIARVRSGVAESHAEPVRSKPPRVGDVRRRPEVVLLRCRYDVRPIFEDASKGTVPGKRDTRLAVALLSGAGYPSIFEIPSLVFQALESLVDWTDQSSLGAAPQIDELIAELARHGLVEVHA